MKWIAVKDKSPNHDDMVVFAEISGGEFCSIVVGNYHYGKFRADTSGLQASNFDGDACIYLDDNMTVTHWMPLPLPLDHIADTSKMVLAELLREAIGEVPQTQSFPSRCDAALAGMEKGRAAAPAQDHIEQPRNMVADHKQIEVGDSL